MRGDLPESIADLPSDLPVPWLDEAELRVCLQAAIDARRRLVESRGDVLDEGERAAVEGEARSALDKVLAVPGIWSVISPVYLLRDAFDRAREAGDSAAVDLLWNLRHEADALGLLADLPRAPASKGDAEPGASIDELRLRGLMASWYECPRAQERLALVDRIAAWPTPAAAPLLAMACEDSELRDRVELLLTLRFGAPEGATAGEPGIWRAWLENRVERAAGYPDAVKRLADAHSWEIVSLWLASHSGVHTGLQEDVDRRAFDLQSAPVADGESVVASRASLPVDVAPEKSAAPAAEVAVRREGDSAAPEMVPPIEEREGVLPRVWREHVRPFFAANWYLVAGIAMVLVGSSVLAYYTWDKHWLVRYTVLPGLLAAFTALLGFAGSWIERRDEAFRGTAAMLRAAAILLLPVNFLAVALLAGDDAVSGKVVAVPLMGTIYLLLGGRALVGWCGAVHESLRWRHAGTLLVLETLVMVGPLALLLVDVSGQALNVLLGAGFYLGFLLLAASLIVFLRRDLTAELVRERRVPWFVGVTLVLTFLQVFAWVHGSIGYLPRVTTYAPMVVLAGWLIFAAERRVQQLIGGSGLHAESFIGFAAVFLGVLMGFGDPILRIVVFALGGCAWVRYATVRADRLQASIALTFFAAAFASVAFVPGFPPEWRPALGIGFALVAALAGRWLPAKSHFRSACSEIGEAVLFLTVIAALLIQWRTHSEPLWTAGWVLTAALLLAWRGVEASSPRAIWAAAFSAALALPYLGFANVAGRTLEGNTMVFGLGILSGIWIVLCALPGLSALRRERSSVLLLYGALGLAGMLLRVTVENRLPVEPGSFAALQNHAGPLLIAATLAIATYTSRSLLPAALAVLICVVLFPELKASFRSTFEALGWGSGLGSASSAVGLILLAAILRRARFLQNLGPGEGFFSLGKFPFCRYDHSLFTWPLLAAAVFLMVRVDTSTLVRRWLLSPDLPLVKTTVAVGLTALGWTSLSVYWRRWRGARFLVWCGCGAIFVACCVGVWRHLGTVHWSVVPLASLAILQLIWIGYRYLEPRFVWVRELLSLPTLAALGGGSLCVALLFCADRLVLGELISSGGLEAWGVLSGGSPSFVLVPFLALQLTWMGLRTRREFPGVVLFLLLAVVCTESASGGVGRGIVRSFLERFSPETGLTPLIGLGFSCSVLGVLCEFLRLGGRLRVSERLAPVVDPLVACSGVVAVVLGLAAFPDALTFQHATPFQYELLSVLIWLVARRWSRGSLWLLGACVAYLGLGVGFTVPGQPDNPLWYLRPDRWSGFAVVLAFLAAAGRTVDRRWPLALSPGKSTDLGEGTRGRGRSFAASGAPWLESAALLSALGGVVAQVLIPRFWAAAGHLSVPFLGSAVFAIVCTVRRRRRYSIGTVLLFALGCYRVLDLFAGDWLQARGLSDIHIVGLALAATLLASSLIGFALRQLQLEDSFWSSVLERARVGCAVALLFVLLVNYIGRPDLAEVTPTRFLISGVMAWIAALYLRHVARSRKALGGQAAWLEGFYQYGVTVALLCLALAGPWLRSPSAAIWALAVPLLWFWLRAEISGRERRRVHVTTTCVIACVLLGFYLFRAAFHALLFPLVEFETSVYHSGSPLVLLTGVLLLRLANHVRSASSDAGEWLAFYGGVAMMAGSYFAITWLPGASPFEHPVTAAWIALALAHFWTLVSHRRSPIRTAVVRVAGIAPDEWSDLRRGWGLCLFAATQAAVLRVFVADGADSLAFAPLLLGSASLAFHHGLLRRGPIWWAIGVVQVLSAAHADFFVPSWLDREYVVWAVLAVQLVLLLTLRLLWQSVSPRLPELVSVICGGLVLAHVAWHHPGSLTGLIALALGTALALMTPRLDRGERRVEQSALCAGLLAVPSWLAFFSQFGSRWSRMALAEPWPWTLALVTLFAVAIVVRAWESRGTVRRLEAGFPNRFFFDDLLEWLAGNSAVVYRTCLTICTLGAVGLVAASAFANAGPLQPLETRGTLTLAALLVGLTVAWFIEGRRERSVLAVFVAEVSVLAFLWLVRQHLLATTSFWTAEYDVWAGLALAAIVAGVQRFIPPDARELRWPGVVASLALPVLGLLQVALEDLSSDLALLVIGLHSLIFAYLGRGSRESPYNVLAVIGFVAFVLIGFWDRLELRVVTAYVIPVCLGLLVLLHLFGQHVTKTTRNAVRSTVLLAMIGSAAYYALGDARYPLVFIGVLAGCGLLAMGLGGMLRVRVHLVAGFAALVVALAALLVRVLRDLERGPRMTLIGAVVLLVGAALIFGTVYYKANRAEWSRFVDRWRTRLDEWE